MHRCRWAATPLLAPYHDEEWGVPCHDDAKLFEMLTLEGAQAGLSWETVLAKREGYRAAFAGFDPQVVARFDAEDVTRLLADARIIRHRGKIESTISNAAALLRLRDAQGSFAAWLWRFTEGRPVVSRRNGTERAPGFIPLSARVSAELRKAGFRFVGPTTTHAFLQACGVLDDHEAGCWRAAYSVVPDLWIRHDAVGCCP